MQKTPIQRFNYWNPNLPIFLDWQWTKRIVLDFQWNFQRNRQPTAAKFVRRSPTCSRRTRNRRTWQPRKRPSTFFRFSTQTTLPTNSRFRTGCRSPDTWTTKTKPICQNSKRRKTSKRFSASVFPINDSDLPPRPDSASNLARFTIASSRKTSRACGDRFHCSRCHLELKINAALWHTGKTKFWFKYLYALEQ